MFRRVVGFVFFLLLVGVAGGALIATGLTAVDGAERWAVVGIVVLGFVAFGLGARRMFRRTWAPVGELIDATTRLGDGQLDVRLKSRRPGPFVAVNASFNRMAQRLADEDERRRKLLADIGHELRTPMTVIRGQIEAVIDGLHPPERLADVLDEVDLMDRLLDDLRVLALAEAGRLELQIESVDLTQLVTDVLDSFDARANAQGVSLAMERESEIDEIAADPYRLHQVFSNLVSHALDQMPDGGSVQVRMAAWPDRVTVSIRDSGPGIDDDSLEGIFQRFEKAGDSKGTGLGLSISRDLVEAHGGTLTAGNHPEGGAAFIVELPRQIASPP